MEVCYILYITLHIILYTLKKLKYHRHKAIAEGQTDILTLQLIGLGFGLGIDIPIVFLFVREFEKMDS